jgi:tRNA pseudouridine38-40 synthase
VNCLHNSAKRFMKQISVTEPFVIKNMEFIRVQLIGQSFMLHQIRKMTGFAIVVIRRELPDNVILRCE